MEWISKNTQEICAAFNLLMLGYYAFIQPRVYKKRALKWRNDVASGIIEDLKKSDTTLVISEDKHLVSSPNVEQ